MKSSEPNSSNHLTNFPSTINERNKGEYTELNNFPSIKLYYSHKSTQLINFPSTINVHNKDEYTQVIENNIEEKVEEAEEKEAEVADTEIENDDQNYILVEDITISEKMDLTQRTGISREDFIDLMSRVKADTSKFFYNNAGTIYDLCEKYELNEIFFCGLISAESGWNIASNHRSTYNYISLMVNGKLKQFSSVEDGLEQAAKTLHENYLTPGGKF